MNGATPLLPLYTFMVLIGKTSLMPPRKHTIPTIRTSKLMLHIKKNRCLLWELYGKHKYTLRKYS